MFAALTAQERMLMRQDYKGMVQGEGSNITIKYRTPLLVGGQPDIDPVYKNDRRMADAIEQSVPNVKCIIRIVHDRDLKILGFGIVEAGDSILYFLDTLNLLEPIVGKPALPQSMYFIDPQGVAWTPVVKEAAALKRFLAMIIGNDTIAQVVPCSLKK